VKIPATSPTPAFWAAAQFPRRSKTFLSATTAEATHNDQRLLIVQLPIGQNESAIGKTIEDLASPMHSQTGPLQ